MCNAFSARKLARRKSSLTKHAEDWDEEISIVGVIIQVRHIFIRQTFTQSHDLIPGDAKLPHDIINCIPEGALFFPTFMVGKVAQVGTTAAWHKK